tara:strand:+ start:63 stop:383 length:321 start_codon:yes stop_codon:yes gene_type:complete
MSKYDLFEKYIKGETERGQGGVLYIKDENCAYIFPSEFNNKDFAQKLQETLDDDEKKNIFFVLEKEKTLHTIAHSRQGIVQEYAIADANKITEEIPCLKNNKTNSE